MPESKSDEYATSNLSDSANRIGQASNPMYKLRENRPPHCAVSRK